MWLALASVRVPPTHNPACHIPNYRFVWRVAATQTALG
jgi:hypothetical protein